jgi:hypothetical protein
VHPAVTHVAMTPKHSAVPTVEERICNDDPRLLRPEMAGEQAARPVGFEPTHFSLEGRLQRK